MMFQMGVQFLLILWQTHSALGSRRLKLEREGDVPDPSESDQPVSCRELPSGWFRRWISAVLYFWFIKFGFFFSSSHWSMSWNNNDIRLFCAAVRSEVRPSSDPAGTNRTSVSCSRTRSSLNPSSLHDGRCAACHCAHLPLRLSHWTWICCIVHFVNSLILTDWIVGWNCTCLYYMVSSFRLGAAARLFKAHQCKFFFSPLVL